MDIFAVAALGIIGALMSVTIKGIRPELAIAVSLATGIAILFYATDGLDTVFLQFREIIEQSGVNVKYFEVAIKACAIAYITQFAAELCRDAGEGAIAVKVELAGKVSIMVLSVPVVSGFLNEIGNLLDKI